MECTLPADAGHGCGGGDQNRTAAADRVSAQSGAQGFGGNGQGEVKELNHYALKLHSGLVWFF